MKMPVRVLLGLVVAAVFFAALELILVAVGFSHQASPPIVIWNRVEDQRLRDPESMHRFHPYWFWEPRPGASVPDCPGEHINAAGFRGPIRPVARQSSKVRVVTLGDSSTFGMGVCSGETFSALLETIVPELEVLNFGVIGFAAFQGEKLFEFRAREYHPDIIVVAFGAVDELLPALDYDVDAKFLITSVTSPTLTSLTEALFQLRTFQLMNRLVRRGNTRSDELAGRTEENWQAWNRGESGYTRTQGVASFGQSLARIVNQARSIGAAVIFVVPPRRTSVEKRWPWAMEYVYETKRTAASLLMPIVDVREVFRSVSNGDEALFVDDYHPNSAGHRLYAQSLAPTMIELSKRGRQPGR